MITAIDTNVLLDILVPNEKFCDASVRALEDAYTAGSLVICGLVYAELCIQFITQRECDGFLESNGRSLAGTSLAAETSIRPVLCFQRLAPRFLERVEAQLRGLWAVVTEQITYCQILPRQRRFWERNMRAG